MGSIGGYVFTTCILTCTTIEKLFLYNVVKFICDIVTKMVLNHIYFVVNDYDNFITNIPISAHTRTKANTAITDYLVFFQDMIFQVHDNIRIMLSFIRIFHGQE